MKRAFIVTIFLMVGGFAHAVESSDGQRSSGIHKREVYLLIGQSNMAGRAPIESMDEGPIDGCELLNAEGKWEPATNPLNKYSTVGKKLSVQKLNPGYGFAKRLHELRPGISVGLVVNARGGTSISKWAKTSTEYDYYSAAVARTQAALADGNSRLAGILWHQGESDGNRTGSYMKKLTALIADLRADFNAPDLPFIAGQVEMDDTDGKPSRVFNDVIIQLPTVVSNTAVVSTEGLLTLDGTHFDSASQRELGRRYADALLSLK
ncbi:Carbohydrate acetyl esterase/feruloyl esterase precursor [Novipirellula aureliae]|uniref:Carbohydrate acetyl esterase/feruloyl esterase n=1 Tax=Novipirellula aureliae TaxID=2527966 RepID=A0A5C6DKL5_9BACT|nr:sialate O-acetylesterase [Novipirellula aureliae]TWU37913.1 Carbohydrate acetyl esterase/feruloyl esterase precursor [Novipirellula aureliae]